MSYTIQEFKDEVNAFGGYENILAMYFNNSNVKVFNQGEVFDPAVNLDEDRGLVIYTQKDIIGREYIVTRKIEYLEGMAFAKDPKERDVIDLRSVRY